MNNAFNRNKARAGRVNPIIPALVGLFIAVVFIAWAENKKANEIRAYLARSAPGAASVEASAPVVDIECRRLNDTNIPYSVHVITDPKSRHRWILIRSGHGLVMTELRPSEFPDAGM